MNINLRGDDGGDEELGAVGVLSGVGHGEEALLGVLELEVLVGELLTIDCAHVQLAIDRADKERGSVIGCGTYWTCHRCRRPW